MKTSVTILLAALASTVAADLQPRAKLGSRIAELDVARLHIDGIEHRLMDEVKNLCTLTVHSVSDSYATGPTRTVYTETETQTVTLDCGCLNAIQVHSTPTPTVAYTTTVTAAGPAKTTQFVCGIPDGELSPLLLPPPILPRVTSDPDDKAKRDSDFLDNETREIAGKTQKERIRKHDLWDQGEIYVTTTVSNPGEGECMSSTEINVAAPDSTKTVYQKTVTVTQEVDCGGCGLEFWTGGLALFAPVTLTSTITAATPSTKFDLSCRTLV